MDEQLRDANDKQAKESERAVQMHEQNEIIFQQLEDYETTIKKLQTDNNNFRVDKVCK